MNKRLLVIIGCAIAIAGAGTSLGVVYARFQKANKDLNSSTVGEMLSEGTPCEDSEEVPQNDTAEAIPETEGAPVPEKHDPVDERAAQLAAAKALKKANKEAKTDAKQTDDTSGQSN